MRKNPTNIPKKIEENRRIFLLRSVAKNCDVFPTSVILALTWVIEMFFRKDSITNRGRACVILKTSTMSQGLRISCKDCRLFQWLYWWQKKWKETIDICLDRYFHALIIGFILIFLVSFQNLRKSTLWNV